MPSISNSRHGRSPVNGRLGAALSATVLALVVSLLTITPLSAPAATAATFPVTSGGGRGCSPAPSMGIGVCFTDPTTRRGRLQMIRELTRLVKQTYLRTPRRNSLRIAMYAWRYPARIAPGHPAQTAVKNFTNAVVRARLRGVNVTVLLDEQNRNGVVHNRLDPRRTGVVRICSNNCLIRTNSIQHNKFFLFNIAGRPDRVVVSSANMTPIQTHEFQNAVSIGGDQSTYDLYSGYFADMRRDSRRMRAVAYGGRFGLKAYGGPLAAGRDPVAEHLNRVTRCTRRHGTVRLTTGSLSAYRFTARGDKLADAIRRLERMGCRTYLLVNQPARRGSIGAEAREAIGLVRRLGTTIRLLPRGGTRIHSKVTLIDAWSTDRAGGGSPRVRQIVLTGSMNLTFGAIRLAAENQLRLEGRGTFAPFNRNFRSMNRLARTS